MLKLLEHLTRAVTGNDQVEVSQSEQEGTVVYTINAPKEVMGLLIGKAGKTIRAIRSLARARAIVDEKRVFVNLEEKA